MDDNDDAENEKQKDREDFWIAFDLLLGTVIVVGFAFAVGVLVGKLINL